MRQSRHASEGVTANQEVLHRADQSRCSMQKGRNRMTPVVSMLHAQHQSRSVTFGLMCFSQTPAVCAMIALL